MIYFEDFDNLMTTVRALLDEGYDIDVRAFVNNEGDIEGWNIEYDWSEEEDEPEDDCSEGEESLEDMLDSLIYVCRCGKK